MEELQVEEDDVAGINHKATQMMNEISNHVMEITMDVKSISKEIDSKHMTEKGISFLELKFHMLLSYLSELSYISLRKLLGQKLEDNPSVERIAELRTVLDRIKPIDKKLHHQIQKLLTTGKTGNFKHDDPLQFKANPESFVNKEDDEVHESVEATGKKQNALYVPPRISAMHYDENETRQSKAQNYLDKIQKRALNSDILFELKKQYDDGPEEIVETLNAHRLKQRDEIRNRNLYEEDNMLRLPAAKKQRHDARQFAMSTLNSISRFDDISALDMNVTDLNLNKGKVKSVKSASKKKWKKRKHFK